MTSVIQVVTIDKGYSFYSPTMPEEQPLLPLLDLNHPLPLSAIKSEPLEEEQQTPQLKVGDWMILTNINYPCLINDAYVQVYQMMGKVYSVGVLYPDVCLFYLPTIHMFLFYNIKERKPAGTKGFVHPHSIKEERERRNNIRVNTAVLVPVQLSGRVRVTITPPKIPLIPKRPGVEKTIKKKQINFKL